MNACLYLFVNTNPNKIANRLLFPEYHEQEIPNVTHYILLEPTVSQNIRWFYATIIV